MISLHLKFMNVQNKLEFFFPGKHFEPSLMHVGKAKSLPYRRTPDMCFTKVGLTRKHKLGRIGLPGTNTLDYYVHS